MVRARLALVRAAGSASDGGEAQVVEDAELATRLAAGDRAALDEIYARYASALFGMLLRLLARTAEAEDALQETFVVAFLKVGQLREKEALRGWLFRIAVREAHTRLRRRKRWRFIGGTDDAADDALLSALVSETVTGEVHAELALLARELAKLPSEQRIAWMLRYVEGEALEDVAAACDCSLATAKRWIAAADQAVRRHVELEEANDV